MKSGLEFNGICQHRSRTSFSFIESCKFTFVYKLSVCLFMLQATLAGRESVATVATVATASSEIDNFGAFRTGSSAMGSFDNPSIGSTSGDAGVHAAAQVIGLGVSL